MELIGEAKAAGVSVLGVDGFYLGPDLIESTMEHCLDLSDEVDRGGGGHEAAAVFVRARMDQRLHFEVVLGEAPATGQA